MIDNQLPNMLFVTMLNGELILHENAVFLDGECVSKAYVIDDSVAVRAVKTADGTIVPMWRKGSLEKLQRIYAFDDASYPDWLKMIVKYGIDNV